MYTVWHVDKYKITFKLVINWTNEIFWHIVVFSGLSRPGIIDARARYRAAARRLRNTALSGICVWIPSIKETMMMMIIIITTTHCRVALLVLRVPHNRTAVRPTTWPATQHRFISSRCDKCTVVLCLAYCGV